MVNNVPASFTVDKIADRAIDPTVLARRALIFKDTFDLSPSTVQASFFASDHQLLTFLWF